MSFLRRIHSGQFAQQDDGLGTLGFRFIRPGRNDGYPWSRKAWGPAKEAISLWIPVIGTSNKETLELIPGSHTKEYECYMPAHSKFAKDEYRLVHEPSADEKMRPELKDGEIIIFHPKLIHNENVVDSSITRLNLEIRMNPI